jgi:hypothetical protein
MLGSTYCLHWQWQDCPVDWQDQFKHGTSSILQYLAIGPARPGPGQVRACGDRARHDTNLKWVMPCQPTGPEAKPRHNPITLTQVVPCHWPARPARGPFHFTKNPTFSFRSIWQFRSNSTKISDYRIRSSELKFRIQFIGNQISFHSQVDT